MEGLAGNRGKPRRAMGINSELGEGEGKLRDDVCGIGTRGTEEGRRQQWRLTEWLTVARK